MGFVILNEVKDLTHCPARFFATEAQNDKRTVILNEVKDLTPATDKILRN